MPCVRTRKEAAICVAITRATNNSASFHHLRTRSMTSESFAECRQNGKAKQGPKLLNERYEAFGPNECAAASAKGCRSHFSAVEKSCSARNPHCSPRPTNRLRKAGP